MLQELPKLMSPFLAQIQVINVANAAGSTVMTSSPPDAPDSPDNPVDNEAALADIRANVAKINANAKAIANAAKAKAKADLEAARISTAKVAAEAERDNDKDGQESGDTTIRNGTNSVVIHHKHSDTDSPGFVVPCVAIFFVFSWLIVKAVMAPFNQRAAAKRTGSTPPASGQVLTDDEQAILLKLQRTIVQMERRVESLETILIDQTRNKEKYGTKL